MTTGTTANGVPFVALPPEGGQAPRGLIVLWHGADLPNSPEALAAALPLRGLPVWRVYPGLPLCGPREPAGGLFALFAEDAVIKGYHPIVHGAVAELPGAVADARKQHGIDPTLPLGIFGFSMGGAAALLSVTRRVLPFRAAATLGPMIDVVGFVDAGARFFNITYEWTEQRTALAEEISSTDRGSALADSGAAVLFGVGAEDPYPALEPAQRLADAMRAEGGAAELSVLPGVPHGFGEEPHAKLVDELVTGWFRRHLIGA